MALPDELLDELLSAHLDGATSGDERARVEQMLREDPAVAERLEDLRRAREAFRQTRMSAPSLPDDFAERVTQQAIDRAADEGLPEEHPLRRAGQVQPVVTMPSPKSSPTTALAWVAALAAGLLLAAFVGWQLSGDGGENGGRPVAQQQTPERAAEDAEPGPEDLARDDAASGAEEDATETRAAVGAGDAGQPQSERIANRLPGAVQPEAMQDDPSGQPAPADAPDPAAMAENADAGRSVAAPGEPAGSSNEAMTSNTAPLQMLMVINVELTETGRDVGAFDQALEKAQIEIGDQRRVNDELARAAVQPGDEASAVAPRRVLLLESPARKLDRLVNQLVVDQDGVASVGFSAITVNFDAPLLKAIDSVRTADPTEIQHQGRGFPLAGQSAEVFQAWSEELGGRTFVPMSDEATAGAVSSMATDSGPDQMANLLFLIR